MSDKNWRIVAIMPDRSKPHVMELQDLAMALDFYHFILKDAPVLATSAHIEKREGGNWIVYDIERGTTEHLTE